jgi:hypothetical protein
VAIGDANERGGRMVKGFVLGEGGFGDRPKHKEKKWQKSNSQHS